MVKRMNFVERRQAALDHPVWIDLGCGANKQPGFIGLDRFALPGVDVVCDLDRGIPLPSGSVDYVLASHSLEHLRDLPAALAEIYRVCKDRAAVTIIAPYAATRLNQANPYHVNVWNEHTARFFTAAAQTSIDTEEFEFPSISEWGLSASDYSASEIDLRCLRTEFTYFAPYRALDERTKRTLRRSLSDVCDQMALHLLVVKAPIARDELAARAASIQYPVPPAFEVRRRDEADTSAQNLFSELAETPARIAALASDTTALAAGTSALGEKIDALAAGTNQEIALLGEEMRRFLQRIDHLDKALIAELGAASRAMTERITAVNSALTRRMQSLAEEVRTGAAAELRAASEQRTAQTRANEQIQHYCVAERRARSDQAFRPLRLARRYRQRGVDLRNGMGGEMARLWQDRDAPQGAFKLQPGMFLTANVARSYRLAIAGALLNGIEVGMLAMFPPADPELIADFELIDGSNSVLRVGAVLIDATCKARPVAIGFEPLACEPGQTFVLKLVPRQNVERIGVQPLEWHKITRILRRVPELRLAWRGQYAA